MFCVIQEIKTQKENKNGYSKELYCYSFGIQGIQYYTYSYSDERFERPIKKAYRISIHHSFRENGKVKKKQFVLCTVNYYDLATDSFTIYDWCNEKINMISEVLKESIDDIYKLVQEKLEPLKEQIQEEFAKTEEYKAHEEHERITTLYALNKTEFTTKYEVDGNEYDICYDVFGKLRNPEYLEKIKQQYRERKEYEEKSHSYQEDFWSNYNKYSSSGSSSYYNILSNNHTDEDKETLKQFYRVLSKKFHPDANPDTDTSKEMQLLNKLKVEWGV